MTGLVEIAPRRFRNRPGLDYDDFEVGDVFEHRPGRTITEADNIWFNLLTMNVHPAHIDSAYSAHSEWGRPLISSTLTLAIVAGMSSHDTSFRAIGNLGWSGIELIAPVFAGDTLYAETEITGKRLSASRPGQGIVSVRTTGTKADGSIFMTFERSFLIAVADASWVERAGY